MWHVEWEVSLFNVLVIKELQVWNVIVQIYELSGV